MKKKAETKAVHIDTIPFIPDKVELDPHSDTFLVDLAIKFAEPTERFADRVTTEDITFEVNGTWYRIPFFLLQDLAEELFAEAMRSCKNNNPPYTGYKDTDPFKRMEDIKEFLDAPYLFEPPQVISFWKKVLSPTIKEYEAFILY